jgi:hypothetical protein
MMPYVDCREVNYAVESFPGQIKAPALDLLGGSLSAQANL